MKEINNNSIPSDDELIALFLTRDEKAIVITDRKYGQFLMKLVKSILPDKRDREECKNDVYLRVWNALQETRPQSLKAYLAQTMRRTALNRHEALKSKKRVPFAKTDSFDELADILQERKTPETELEEKQLTEVINSFVRALPETERCIFIERYYFARPVKTIAKKLSVSSATAYREIEKIKQKLMECLERSDITL